MRVYYTTINNGDGSADVQFFESSECIALLEEADPETYGMGEGGSYLEIDGTLIGEDIYTLAEVKNAIVEMDETGYLDLIKE